MNKKMNKTYIINNYRLYIYFNFKIKINIYKYKWIIKKMK